MSARARRWPLVLLLGGTLLLSGCGLFGGDEEEDPPAELLKFKPSLQLRKAWSARVGDGSEHLRLGLSPATDGTLVYAAAHDGRVAAFEAGSGKRRWAAKTRLPLSGGPATDGELVVAGSSNGEVIALRAADGKRRWVGRVSSEVLAAPAIGGGLVLVRGVDGKLTALRQDDGSEAWFVQQSVPRLSVRGTGAPVIAGNVVLAGFDNGKVAAYEMSDGTLLWETLLTPPRGRTEVDRLVDINATIRVVGEDVYVVGYHGSVALLALESGQVLWARELSSYNEFALDFLNIYVSTETSEVVALSRRNGREAWRIATLLNRDVSGPAAWKNSVVVGDFEGYLHWFNAANGELQARMRAGSKRIALAPLVVGELLVAQSEDGKLYAFSERGKR
ncbi:MAG: outer membrane protein assembly factor BamB [Gammaproteobacteria bacterium]|nr:MAG: outer membrane protein assembly factor BamB [Gammaproteobacteria bacterium]